MQSALWSGVSHGAWCCVTSAEEYVLNGRVHRRHLDIEVDEEPMLWKGKNVLGEAIVNRK